MQTVTRKLIYPILSLGLCPLLIGQAALAQDELESESTTGILETVTVTAQRREQNLMDVPLSVLAWDGDILEKSAIDNITLVADITPGLVASGQSSTTGGVNFFIRGIGSNSGGDPAVAYYVDEIYVGATNAFNSSFIDLDRVEILKGPQGTLWGRNTTGGAINIVTKRPSREFGAQAYAEYADPYTLKLAAALTGPIGDITSYRVTVSKVEQDSYVQNTLTSRDDKTEDSISFRGQLRFEPSEKLTIDVLYGYLKDDAKNLFLFPTVAFPGTGSEFVGNYFNVPPDPDLYHIQLDHQPTSDFTGDEFRLDVNYEISDAYNLRWLSGYNKADSYRDSDFDGNFLPLLNSTRDLDDRWLSSELQFQYTSERSNWTAGLYYYDQDTDQLLTQDGDTDFFQMASCASQNYLDSGSAGAAFCPLANSFYQLNVPDIFFGTIPGFALPSLPYFTQTYLGRSPIPEDMSPTGENPLAEFGLLPNLILGTGTEVGGGYGNLFDTGLISNQYQSNSIRSIAAYFQGNWQLTDQWSVTAGLRYTEDEKSLTSQVLGTLFAPDILPAQSGKDTRDAWTPKIGVEFKPNDDTLVYGSFTTGFKGAGFGALNNITGELSTFDEEKINAYEIGYKATLAGGSVRIDVAAFYYDYQDMQLTIQLADGAQTSNVDSVDVKGIDFAMDWAPVDMAVVGMSVSYLDSEITKYTGSDVFDPTAYALGVQDIVGNPLPRAPEWSGNAFARYTWLLGNNSSITLGGNAAYTGDYNHTQFGNVLMTPSYTLYNANLTWTSPTGAFSVNTFGRNLSNEEYVLTSFYTDSFGVLMFPGAPRVYGVQLRYSFN